MVHRPCEECLACLYKDIGKGQITGFEEKYLDRNTGLPIPRDPALAPPCKDCPKGDPERGRGTDKALPLALQVLDCYEEAEITGGKTLPRRVDPLVAQILALAARSVRSRTNTDLAKRIGSELYKVLPYLFRVGR